MTPPITIFFVFASLCYYWKQKKNKYQYAQINQTTFFLETEACVLEMYKYVFIFTVQRDDLRVVLHELSNDDPSTHSKCLFVVTTVYNGEKECPFVCLPVKTRFNGLRPSPPPRSQHDSSRKGPGLSSLHWINIGYSNHIRFSILTFKNQEKKCVTLSCASSKVLNRLWVWTFFFFQNKT